MGIAQAKGLWLGALMGKQKEEWRLELCTHHSGEGFPIELDTIDRENAVADLQAGAHFGST